MIKFTIPITPVTKKNHGMIIHLGEKCPLCKRGKKSIMLPSKQYIKYEKDCKKYIPKMETITSAVEIKYTFYKDNKRLCDLSGLIQAIDDILVKYKVIADDNYSVVASHDNSRVFVDKNNPRTEIEITEFKEVKE